jgi:large subunit ribosomal protein L25
MTITLAVAKRDETTKIEDLRVAGKIPAVVYGRKQEATPITLDAKDFDKVRKEAGESTLIELEGLDEEMEVLIHDIEFNPVRQEVMHADLYAIERGKEMTTNVVLEFINEAPVETSRTGTITKVLHEIDITCKPKDLPSHIEVDLSSLEKIEDKILIQDLVLPTGVTAESDPEDPVVVVSEIREEKEEEPETVDMDAIEVEQKGKEESEDEEGN